MDNGLMHIKTTFFDMGASFMEYLSTGFTPPGIAANAYPLTNCKRSAAGMPAMPAIMMLHFSALMQRNVVLRQQFQAYLRQSGRRAGVEAVKGMIEIVAL